MLNLYNYNLYKLCLIVIVPTILAGILINLNKFLHKLLSIKSLSSKRSTLKGLETYEFGASSIGNIVTISNNQFIILSILFLIFDIELIFLIP